MFGAFILAFVADKDLSSWDGVAGMVAFFEGQGIAVGVIAGSSSNKKEVSNEKI